MKKQCLILAITVYLASPVQSQTTWDMNLNSVPSGTNPNFGTSSSHPINFFTKNTQRMRLDTNGILNINGLAGTGCRFLQVHSNGDLTPYNPLPANSNKVLYGDGLWHDLPGGATTFNLSGQNLTSPIGIRLGIGVPNPTKEFELNGSGEISTNLGVSNYLFLGPTTSYGTIKFTPATATTPGVLDFGFGGSGGGAIPNPRAGGESPDTPIDYECINGPNEQNPAPLIGFFPNSMNVYKKNTLNTAYLGFTSIGHDGNNGYIETKGTNPTSPNAGDLVVNGRCNRNVYVFGNSNGNSYFATSSNKVMSIQGSFNVCEQMQVGGSTFLSSFSHSDNKIYVYSQNTPVGLRVRHGSPNGGGVGVKIVEVSDSDHGIAVYKGVLSPPGDGAERFSVRGDGKTTITSTNADALTVSDAANPANATFKVESAGNIYVSGNVGIGVAPSTANIFNINAGANSTNANLLNIGSTNVPNAFSINSNGVAIFDAKGTSSSVFRIRNQGYDLVAVRHDGVLFAREVVVTLQQFPDYVFSEDYRLMPLEDVRTFIQLNKRLPNMPSATQVAKDGANLGEIQRITVEKVEELYLYILHLEEKIEKLNREINSNR